MAKIKLMPNSYNNDRAYANVINFAVRDITEFGCTGGSGCDFISPSAAIAGMSSIYEVYRAVYGDDTDRLEHYIITFAPGTTADKKQTITAYLQHLCSVFGQKHQCFWALHLVNPNPVVNKSITVNFIVNKIAVDGSYLSDANAEQIKLIMTNLLEQYDIEKKEKTEHFHNNFLMPQSEVLHPSVVQNYVAEAPATPIINNQEEQQLIKVISYV